jgi:hypothetical protein
VAVGVGVGVLVAVAVGVGVGVLVAVAVGVGVGVLVAVAVAVAVGVTVGVTVGVAVGVARAPPWDTKLTQSPALANVTTLPSGFTPTTRRYPPF